MTAEPTVSQNLSAWRKLANELTRIASIREEPARLTRAPVAVAKSAGEQLKRVRGASGKKTAWRKDCDASGVKSFYDSGVRL